jgi:hypothetical protein
VELRKKAILTTKQQNKYVQTATLARKFKICIIYMEKLFRLDTCEHNKILKAEKNRKRGKKLQKRTALAGRSEGGARELNPGPLRP